MTQPPQPPRSTPRVLALDPGERRTGVAVSDDLGLFAHPRPALLTDTVGLPAAIAQVVAAEAPDEVVVGLPLSMTGRDSAQTKQVRALVSSLRASLDIPVTTWDERLTSTQAARTVKGVGRRKRGDLDSAAAAIILQAVLDSRRGGVS